MKFCLSLTTRFCEVDAKTNATADEFVCDADATKSTSETNANETKTRRKTTRESKNETEKIRVFFRAKAEANEEEKMTNKKIFFSANSDVTIKAILRKKILIEDNEFFLCHFVSC